MEISLLEPVDYLLIGHISVDQIPPDLRLGGTVTYAGLTARALGLRVGIVTSWANEVPLGPLQDLPIASFPTDRSTTFENIYSDNNRIQYLRHIAPGLDFYQIPEPWRAASIVHLGPIAQEVEPGLVRNFPDALVGVTPQGWMRAWKPDGKVYNQDWPEASFVLQRSAAAVISTNDVAQDESRIDELAASCKVLAVTEGSLGARLYWNGDVRRFRAPKVNEIDPTGAGDIFAAAFFTRLFQTHDPWEAARFAVLLGAISVTRPGLQGIPTPEEIKDCLVEVY